jgi:hypothetical protein
VNAIIRACRPPVYSSLRSAVHLPSALTFYCNRVAKRSCCQILRHAFHCGAAKFTIQSDLWTPPPVWAERAAKRRRLRRPGQRARTKGDVSLGTQPPPVRWRGNDGDDERWLSTCEADIQGPYSFCGRNGDACIVACGPSLERSLNGRSGVAEPKLLISLATSLTTASKSLLQNTRSGTVVYAGVPFFFLARHTIHRAMAKETNKSKSSRNSAIVREHP